ncbi:response regulator [Thauera sp.]|jgi:DNA-binding NarL/FixJ family response regulator|uniref:response regulator n=1 Tax=Thauera sp. TaxID=1905334 RepID=UPI00262EA24D|nr:response regulator [Thauera sp.]MCK6408750.1 response regulator [Thauera sp.]
MTAPLHAEPATAPALRVVLVEDSAMLRGMLREMLAELDGVGVVAEAEDEAGALAALEAQRPDLAIIDLELRTGSGLGVLRQMQAEPERFGRPRAVVFSNYGHAPVRARCEQLGVERFFDKSFQLDELIDFVQAAVPG